jgi:hypothetical protein
VTPNAAKAGDDANNPSAPRQAKAIFLKRPSIEPNGGTFGSIGKGKLSATNQVEAYLWGYLHD